MAILAAKVQDIPRLVREPDGLRALRNASGILAAIAGNGPEAQSMMDKFEVLQLLPRVLSRVGNASLVPTSPGRRVADEAEAFITEALRALSVICYNHVDNQRLACIAGIHHSLAPVFAFANEPIAQAAASLVRVLAQLSHFKHEACASKELLRNMVLQLDFGAAMREELQYEATTSGQSQEHVAVRLVLRPASPAVAQACAAALAALCNNHGDTQTALHKLGVIGVCKEALVSEETTPSVKCAIMGLVVSLCSREPMVQKAVASSGVLELMTRLLSAHEEDSLRRTAAWSLLKLATLKGSQEVILQGVQDLGLTQNPKDTMAVLQSLVSAA